MAKKTQAEIEAMFKPYLHDGEEFRWLGEPQKNSWKLNLLGILKALISTFALISYRIVRVTLPVVSILSIVGLIIYIGYLNIFCAIIPFFVFLHSLDRFGQEKQLKVSFSVPKLSPKTAIANPTVSHNIPFIWGQRSYYAITNQRIMISERGPIHDYSLLLMVDAAVGKPHEGVSNIHVYNSTNPTGQLPEPVFELKGIVEEKAQSAYEILRQAREEALEDRAREMGID